MAFNCGNLIMCLKSYWKPLVIITVPLLLSPLVLYIGTIEAKCAYVVLLMAIYWMTEALPLAVTSLIPLILYPPLGVLTAAKTSEQYLKDSNMVFFGSLLMALAVEESQLHRRIALHILLRIGTSPRRLMLGFTVSTGFLSMWMSNTAACAMMVPLALAILEELPDIYDDDPTHAEKQVTISASSATLTGNLENGASCDSRASLASHCVTVTEEKPRSAGFLRASKGVLLSICYAANIGGTGTLTGTASNIVLTGQLDSLYHSRSTGVTFASWMAFAVPQMIILLTLAWLWLTFLFVGFRDCKNKGQHDGDGAKTLLARKLEELGKTRFIEKMTMVLLVTLVLLWLLRDPGFMPGWDTLFRHGYVSDGTVAMFIGTLFFFIPKELPHFGTCCTEKAPMHSITEWRPLLTWDVMKQKFSWSVLLILGGGYAMATGVEHSGLDDWISRGLSSTQGMPKLAFVIIITLVVTFLTEFSSNAAIASVFIPIGASMAELLQLNPLYLIIPITVGCSFAFMLPAATPPNSIVFVAGVLRVVDMALAGFAMNIFCVAVLLVNISTYGYWLYDLGSVPDWAKEHRMNGNVSLISP